MRRRSWVILLICLAAISLLCSRFTSASSSLRVNESATKFLFEQEHTGPALALENSLGRQVSARVLVELLSPQGVVTANAERDETIKEGASSLFIPLNFQASNLKDTERSQLLWYRLRYSITPKDSSDVWTKSEGIISLSEITPDIFEVHLTNYQYAFAGGRFQTHLRATHPITGRAIAGVQAEAQIKIAEDGKPPVILRAAGTTDAEGYATLAFDLPKSVKTDEAEIKITARRGGLLQEAEDTIRFDQMSRIFISTDKPLYQPGQTLHARALVFTPSMKAVVDEETPFKIEDPEGTTVFRADLRTSRFGIASIDWPIPENARLGEYTVSFGRPDDSYAIYRIKISRYDLPNFTTRVKPDRAFYLPGQNAEVEVSADYLFGQMVKRGHVRVVRETEREWNYREQKWETKEGDKYEGETDATGRFVAHVNLQKEYEDLKESDYERFKDVSYAAYFTDPSTNRTEQRRFDLRVTKEAIHVYVVGDTYDQSSRLPLEFYVSTFYADGTPVPSNVIITKGSSDDDRSGAKPGKGGGRRVANIETNSFGLAKVSLPKPPLDEGDDRVYLRFSAKDAQGQAGHWNEDFSYEDRPGIRVHMDKTLYQQGEPIRVNLTSSEKNLEAVVDVVHDLQVLRSEVVHLSEGHASLWLPFDEQFKDGISIMACAGTGAREEMCDSRNILYPRDKDLKLDVRPEQATYRPGEEARVQFNVLAPDGRAIESALGIAVFDRAVEERARTDQEFGSHYNFYGNYGDLLGWDDSLAGVSRKDLERLDLSKPLPKGLELLAEVMLNRNGHFSPNEFSGDDYDLEQQKVFADLFKKELDPIRAALNARYWGRALYPKDEGMLHRMLAEFDINLDTLRDPWGTPYRTVFYVNRENDMLKFVSAGADKRFDTADDFSAAEFSWPYFKPLGETIDRAIKNHHARTGGFIRNATTFQTEMLSEGVDFNSLRDRWNEPYRVVFDVNGVNYILKIVSNGPDRKFESSANQSDDFTLWTSMIDYFAERRAEIDAALNSYLKATHTFPQDTQNLSVALRKSGIDFDALRDPWGHKYYATFKTDSRFTDRVTIETRSDYGEKPQTHTVTKPVTQKVGIVAVRSAGADGVQGTVDDFDAGTFSLVLSEQDRSDAKPVSVKTSAILTGNGGAITGQVLDPLGAVIPNANVRATLSSTQTFYEAVTDAEGKFTLVNLPSGTYEVRVTATGFRDTVVTNLLVSSSNILTLNLTLQVGATAETVTVTSESAQVETSMSSQQVTELPINGRSAYGLVTFRGGAVNIVTKSGTSDRLRETSTPRLREYFPETLLWQPSLETDAKGQASLRFKLADNITTWKMAVIGSTANGEIGMAEKEILAFQPFFVEHDPPRILTEGDEINLPVVLRNYLDKSQTVLLEMHLENWFTLLGPAQRRALVPAGDNSRQTFDFRAVASIKDGKQRVTAKGATDASDQIERSVSVHPFGEEVAKTTNGILGDTATLETLIPANVINKTAHAELKIYPSLVAHVVESIEGIMQRPYGCAEQTISAAYPGLLALRADKAMGKEHPLIESKARRFVQQGYERLLNYRAPDGGFSYWGRGSADLALTAYALRFLHDAGEFIEVDAGVIKEAREWLGKQQRGDGSWPAPVWWEKTEDKRRTALLTAYIARVLAETGDREDSAEANNNKTAQSPTSSALKRALHYLSERYTEVDEPYLIAAYALALLDAGDLKGAEAPIAKLRMLAHEEAGTNYWSLETNTPFYGWGLTGRIETTALALQAMTKYCEKVGCEASDKVSPNPYPPTPIPQLIDRGLLFLLKQEDRYGVWYSTQATVNTLDALVALLSQKGSADAGGQAQVFVNGKFATNVGMPPGDRLTSPLIVDLSPFISTGSNRIEIRRAGASAARASVQVVETYYVPWPTVAARDANHSSSEDAAGALRLNVVYDKSSARVGEEVVCKVEAERIGFKGYGMMLAEIGLPPGADVDRATLEDAMKNSGWSLSRYDVLSDRLIVYLWPQAGGARFEFKFRPRFGLAAESAPSLLYDYYNPEARTTVAPTKFLVK